MTLPRGFKAQAERQAAGVRCEWGLKPSGRLAPEDLADHVKATVVSADRLVSRESLEQLERLQAYAFSAATFDVQGRTFIVVNPLRHDARKASDIAHEVSHLMLQHELSEVREVEGVPFRTCRPDEEEQATALGGTLLLPRPFLMQAALRGDGPKAIAETYGVTLEMARYRYNATGVGRQVAHRGR